MKRANERAAEQPLLRCIAIQDEPALVESYIAQRLELYADCPPSLPQLLRARVFAVYRGAVMVGGFTLFVGSELPLHAMLPLRLATRARQLRRAPSVTGPDCEIGVVWLKNPRRDAALSVAFWNLLLSKAAAVGADRYFFRYDHDSARLRRLYRFAFSRTLHVSETTTATGAPSRIAICQVSLAMMRFNLSLYTLRRQLAERWRVAAARQHPPARTAGEVVS